MIERVSGDILKADAEALVNTVNCVGVMGRGIALQFRKAFPENFKAYASLCKRKQLQVGQVFLYDLNRLENPRYVVNFPTKRHWKGKSRIEDIRAGLEALLEVVRDKGIQSIAIPPLGCGLGGLEWAEVRPEIEQTFQSADDVTVRLFEPQGAPSPEAMATGSRRPVMTVGRASLLGLMQRYLAALMDVEVSLLEIHKLMYFMQEAGQPLKLDYVKGTYGPYAGNLRHVLSHIEGHFVRGYGDAEDNPDKQIELDPAAAEEAEGFLRNEPETQLRFNRVSDLIDGFETPFGMELLATVHWVATREGARGTTEAIAQTYAWTERKRMFKEQHIRIAWQVLHDKKWLSYS